MTTQQNRELRDRDGRLIPVTVEIHPELGPIAAADDDLNTYTHHSTVECGFLFGEKSEIRYFQKQTGERAGDLFPLN